MQLIKKQQEYRQLFTELYYFSANQTDKYWVRDTRAALKIQSAFRMYIKRKQFLIKLRAAVRIQTQVRGWRSRKLINIRKVQENNLKNLLYFARQAVVIQKMFRGFFVRKYVHNFYLRKQELQALERKNEQFKKQLEAFGKAQIIQSEQYQKQQAKAQFKFLAKNLHHLTSTKNIPGVYNSPFAAQKPVVFDQTVEDHLQQQFKSTYKWKPPNKQSILKHSLRSEARKLK